MDDEADALRQVVVGLFEAGGIKVQDVVLKTGLVSPIYVDLRVIVSHPTLLRKLAGLLCHKISKVTSSLKFESICGVPYTALPIATAVSLQLDVPMLMRRKETKSYGTKKQIEGCFKDGDVVLVLEDVLTSGTSILETVNSLTGSKLRVTDAVVVLDRNQNGIQNLQKLGITVHWLFDLIFVTSVLVQEGKITAEAGTRVTAWLQNNATQLSSFAVDQRVITGGDCKRLPFNERKLRNQDSVSSNKLTSKIFDVIHRKKSNLCLAADFDNTDQVLAVAENAGPHIAILKLHADILTDFSDYFVERLQSLAQKHDFILFEDRKFADIGNTVRMQYSRGIHRIQDWAELVTCHVTPGPGVLQGLQSGLSGVGDRGCVLITQMSSSGSLLKQDAVEAAFSFAQSHPDFVVGFICQNSISCNPSLIHMTPGVASESGSDSMGQQYLGPEEAIKNGADIVIVGRAVTAAGDESAQLQAVINLKERAYQSYLNQCQ